MEDPNFDFLKSKFHVSEDVYKTLRTLATYKKVKRGEIYLEQGAKSKKMAFLASGLMRSYQILETGKEVTKNLYLPFSFIGPYSSILKRETSLLNHQALVDSTLYEINFEEFIAHSKKNIDISNLYNRVLEHVFITYEKKYLDHITLNASERYQLLKQRVPNIENLIPLYQIASYLNISPVQMSRIRRQN